MRIGITGASGFIGRHLVRALLAGNHEAVAFSRSPGKPVSGCIETRPLMAGDSPDLRGLDGIVNLAGASIIQLWTQAHRRRIVASRLGTTRGLVQGMKGLPEGGPRILVSASAVGLYGDRADEELRESSAPGTGFLAEVCQQWEASALEAVTAGVRTSCLRIGYVLGSDGGAFPALQRAFRLGLGGRIGSGRQWMPIIHIDDVVGLIVHLLENPAAAGAYNAVCPNPIRNVDFTKALARALHRPTILPAPAFALRAALGDLSHVLLDSARVLPERALASNYRFEFPDLDHILAGVIGR